MSNESTVIKGISVKETKNISNWAFYKKDLFVNRYIYLMVLPLIIYYIIFHYIPMYGAQIAFKDFSPSRGIFGSSWVGVKHFGNFLQSYYFWRLLRNTILINLYDIIFGFPAPIILALLLNEVKSSLFKRAVQTITYLPHFISIMVITGMIIDFTTRDGLINQLVIALGREQIQFLIKPEWFRPIYIGSGIWQNLGWGTIIYLATLSNIDSEQYEAAMLDGAGRWKQMLYVTLPGLAPTIIILFVLRLGQMMNVGAEKVLLLYNPSTYETADVISTFVYRKGILESSFSYSSAVGLFNSLINFTILLTANRISRKMTETSLW